MKKVLGSYKNGNILIIIHNDGTKIRYTKDDEFVPSYSESIDCTITECCDGGCSFCYLGCTANGKHGDIMDQKWVDSLHPYTELALNGNDMSHPDLIPFLEKVKSKNVFANLTVNQKHFMQHKELLHDLVNKELVRGVGISLVEATEEFIDSVKEFDDAVIHTINGILSKNDINKLADNDLKLLILGYKNLGRGVGYANSHSEELAGNQQWLHDNFYKYVDRFKVMSFDNLALKQLDVKDHLTNEEWERFFAGTDGDFTFFIDAVNHEFSVSSTMSEKMRFPLKDNVDDMFKVVRRVKAA